MMLLFRNWLLEIILTLAIIWPLNKASVTSMDELSHLSVLSESFLGFIQSAEYFDQKNYSCGRQKFDEATSKHRDEMRLNYKNNCYNRTAVRSPPTYIKESGPMSLETKSAVNSGSRKIENSRFFFYKGIKKMMWTIFIGLQIAKTALLALFLPSILGSLGKIVGKGLSTVSGFIRPNEVVNDLTFIEHSVDIEHDSQYHHIHPKIDELNNAEANGINFPTNFEKPVSRLGIGDQKLTHVNLPNYASKNSNSLSSSVPTNKAGSFFYIPASSQLLTTYDPFYSPLLSRLDSVFKQLNLQSKKEICREKLVCFMYSNPAKYAPYSNLVSAQLSRELNELRKPILENPEILRFFKYMKAAKLGQDGKSCGVAYSECNELTESSNPVMVASFHDINKLVQARRF